MKRNPFFLLCSLKTNKPLRLQTSAGRTGEAGLSNQNNNYTFVWKSLILPASMTISQVSALLWSRPSTTLCLCVHKN